VPPSRRPVAIRAAMPIKGLHRMAPPQSHRMAILANPWSTRIRWVLLSEAVLLAALLADGRATRTSTVAHPTPHLPTLLEERNRKSQTTYPCLGLELARQAHTITKKARTTTTLHRSTAPMATDRMEVSNPSFEMCKREGTRESRGHQHFPNKATRVLPRTSNTVSYVCICMFWRRYMSEKWMNIPMSAVHMACTAVFTGRRFDPLNESLFPQLS